ncbi:unnamed protein product [Rangifer tarandus platyrhynchus]|uniref:Uncharacterized protein n=1 Tax=Rangifer tarandus platyrhynchus TaxID=3082113 RepID=A0ABN8ZTL8_RANTA|nr:unnamed protein product [Rangifer tarandus platyrhynchus]
MTSGENRTGRIHSRPSPGSPSHASSPLRATRAPIAQPRPRDPLSDPPAPPRARPHRLPSIPGAHSPGGAPQPLVTRPAPPPPAARPVTWVAPRVVLPGPPARRGLGDARGGASGRRAASPWQRRRHAEPSAEARQAGAPSRSHRWLRGAGRGRAGGGPGAGRDFLLEQGLQREADLPPLLLAFALYWSSLCVAACVLLGLPLSLSRSGQASGRNGARSLAGRRHRPVLSAATKKIQGVSAGSPGHCESGRRRRWLSNTQWGGPGLLPWLPSGLSLTMWALRSAWPRGSQVATVPAAPTRGRQTIARAGLSCPKDHAEAPNTTRATSRTPPETQEGRRDHDRPSLHRRGRAPGAQRFPKVLVPLGESPRARGRGRAAAPALRYFGELPRGRKRGEQSGGGEGGPGPGRAERATLRAFVSGGAEAAAAAGRPERRMRRRAARIEGRCGGRLRGARPGAWRDLCV